MTVETADVIDFVFQNPKTNEVLLVMVEARDWNSTPEALPQLHAKFLLYAEYAMSGALARQHPEMADMPMTIRLDHFAPINGAVAVVLRQWAGRLSGLKVGVCSYRLYCNRAINFIQGLRARFFDPNHGVVRWEPDPGSTQVLTNHAQFTEEFVAALRQAMPDAQIEIVGDLELRIKSPGGMDHHGFLANAYNQCVLVPENKDEIIRKFVTSLRETAALGTGVKDKSRIVPIIKDKAWVEEVNRSMKEQRKGKEVGSVHEPYNQELTVVYAEDTPANVRYLTTEDFAELKIDLKDLHSLACANLQKLIAEPDIQEDGGVFRVKAGGDYDACILLLEDFWAHAQIPVDGELVAAVPARDFLAVTGSNNSKAIARLKLQAQAVASQASYRLTPKLFVRRNGRFVDYDG